MATRVATGIQSALGRCSPKAIATATDKAIARISTNRITGLVSLTGAVSPGRTSAPGCGCAVRPRASQMMPV